MTDLTADERSYRAAQALGYELPEEPAGAPDTLRHCDLPCCNPEEDPR